MTNKSKEERDSLVCDCGDILEANLTERLKTMKRGQERRFASLIAGVVREREAQARAEGAMVELESLRKHYHDVTDNPHWKERGAVLLAETVFGEINQRLSRFANYQAKDTNEQ